MSVSPCENPTISAAETAACPCARRFDYCPHPENLEHCPRPDLKNRYPRYALPEHLALCDAQLQSIYFYWEARCGGRPMPSRRDIHPEEIVDFLPGVMLVDILREDQIGFRYRLVGTREVEARGEDPTGLRVGESFFGGTKEQTLENYRTVAATGKPLYDAQFGLSFEARLQEKGTIFLPLSSGGSVPNQILVFTAYRRF